MFRFDVITVSISICKYGVRCDMRSVLQLLTVKMLRVPHLMRFCQVELDTIQILRLIYTIKHICRPLQKC